MAAHPGARPTAPTVTAYTRPRRPRSGVRCASCWIKSVRRWLVLRSGAGGDSGDYQRCGHPSNLRSPHRFIISVDLLCGCSHSSNLRSPHLMVRSPLICSVKPQVRRRKIGVLQAREGANDWILRCRSTAGFAWRITTTHNGRRSKSLGFYVDRGLQIRIQPRAAARAHPV